MTGFSCLTICDHAEVCTAGLGHLIFSCFVIISPSGSIYNMAPSPLLITAVNLSRRPSLINSLADLLQFRDDYLQFVMDIRDAAQNSPRLDNNERLIFLAGDSVEQDMLMNGGLGAEYQSERTDKVLRLLEDSINRRILQLQSVPLETEPATYNSQSHILRVCGVDVLISERAESQATALLKVLFKQSNKPQSTDVIQEKWSGGNAKNAPYQAAIRVNEIVSSKTSCKGFLLPTTKDIRINPEYL